MLSFIINSLNLIPSEVLRTSFESTGIWPFNMNKPLKNQLTNQVANLPGSKSSDQIFKIEI